MIVKTRSNVFETNSSSMHSFIKTKDNVYPEYEKDFLYSINNGVYIVNSNCEFGWGFDILKSLEDKLAYVLTAYSYHDTEFRELTDTLTEKLAKHFNCNLDSIVFNHRNFLDDTDNKNLADAYIDHQSQGDLEQYLEDYNIDVVDFITDSRYQIIISNDNGGECYENRYYSDDGTVDNYPDNLMNLSSAIEQAKNGAKITRDNGDNDWWITFEQGDLFLNTEEYWNNTISKNKLEQLSINSVLANDWKIYVPNNY